MSRQRLDAQIASVRAAIAGEPEPEGAAAPAAAVAAPAQKRRGRKPGSKNKTKAPKEPKAPKPGKPGRRKLSPAARKAIADAQKRRWEEFRKNNPK